MIMINEQLFIPNDELIFTASRSSGPGGQNVNKLNTRITLWFDVDHSRALNDEQKSILHRKLATRINKSGHLWVVSKQHRTQLANRQAAIERFIELLTKSFAPHKIRKKTRISKTAQLRRLDTKRRKGEIKKNRLKLFRAEE